MTLTLRTFRVLIGSLILVTHFGCIGLVLYFTIDNYDASQILTFISAVAPITGLYAYTYWRYIVFARERLASEQNKSVSAAAWITQLSVIGLFCLAVMCAPLYFFGPKGTETDLPSVLAVIETIFGIYLARSFSTLFPVEVLGEEVA